VFGNKENIQTDMGFLLSQAHTRTDTGIVDTIEKDAHACMQFALVVDRLYSCVIYMETINIYYAIKCLARDSIITSVHHPPDWCERN
jgi:hypothetical protein